MSYQEDSKIPLQDEMPMSYQNTENGCQGETIVLQPQRKGNNQPEALNSWSTNLFDCLDDIEVCLCGGLCPCIHCCMLADTLGECFCTPYLPGARVAMRTSLRNRFNIKGSIATDALALCCCFQCSLCQMARELKNRH
ncbi:cornifelin-like [Ambystoma mexicanum]|uniref:cornifelin-like n=1 Tax=Ambystoma mexicanum TaxID=8296 RepID=UPI0037E94CD1